MAYFPNAFKKIFIPKPEDFKTAVTTDNLTAGAFGFFNSRTWAPIATANASAVTHPSVILAMGSYRAADKIGSHGGYKESVKSKPINPRHIHRFYKVAGHASTAQIVTAGYQAAVPGSAPSFDKGKTYLLRIDLKGSPALRFFGRNLYHTFDASGGCLDDTCTDPCDPAAKIDPVSILLQWADQIKEDPIFSKFINPVVSYTFGGSTNVASSATYVPKTAPADISAMLTWMDLQVAYIDTVFGNCSFDPRDHYELEPLQIYASLVDESGNPCKIPSLLVKEKQAPRSPSGVGETILRDVILSNRYSQDHYQLDNRRKETENGNSITHDIVSRSVLYDSYYLLYSVPRHANPSSTQDADQYLLQLSVPAGADMSAFTAWMQAYLTSAGNGVVLETIL